MYIYFCYACKVDRCTDTFQILVDYYAYMYQMISSSDRFEKSTIPKMKVSQDNAEM